MKEKLNSVYNRKKFITNKTFCCTWEFEAYTIGSPTRDSWATSLIRETVPSDNLRHTKTWYQHDGMSKNHFLSVLLRKDSSLISANLTRPHPRDAFGLVGYNLIKWFRWRICPKVVVHVFSLYVVRVSSWKMAWLFILTGLMSLKKLKKDGWCKICLKLANYMVLEKKIKMWKFDNDNNDDR